MKNYILLFLFLSFVSCKKQLPQALIPNYENIKNVSISENFLSSMLESSRIIRLETTPDCFFGNISKIIKKDSLFFIKTYEDELVLFDNDGKYIRKFGKKGRGPGEFFRIQDFAVNEEGTIVAIGSLKDILFYRISDGNFIGKQTFEYAINNFIFLPNDEILARIVHADYLIAHFDNKGKILNTFGLYSRVLELTLPFEFIKFDDSNYLYKVGWTSDTYQYDIKKKSVQRTQILESKNVLREEALHNELEEAGPEADYRAVKESLNNHVRIASMKVLNSNYFFNYYYKGDVGFALYNWDSKIKKEIILTPESNSNFTDDVYYFPNSVFSQVTRAESDDNSILGFLYSHEFIKQFGENIPDGLKNSGNYIEIQELLNSLTIDDNPLIIEYFFKEI